MKSQAPKKESKDKPSKPALSLPERVEQERANVAKWKAIAADPELSQEAALFARNIARSSQAALTLGEKALQYQKDSQAKLDEALQARLARTLNVTPSPPDQLDFSGQSTPPSSTKPETSA
jgi:hypothetical protein